MTEAKPPDDQPLPETPPTPEGTKPNNLTAGEKAGVDRQMQAFFNAAICTSFNETKKVPTAACHAPLFVLGRVIGELTAILFADGEPLLADIEKAMRDQFKLMNAVDPAAKSKKLQQLIDITRRVEEGRARVILPSGRNGIPRRRGK